MLISISALARRMTSSPEVKQLLDPAYRARITEELTREVEAVRLCDELPVEAVRLCDELPVEAVRLCDELPVEAVRLCDELPVEGKIDPEL